MLSTVFITLSAALYVSAAPSRTGFEKRDDPKVLKTGTDRLLPYYATKAQETCNGPVAAIDVDNNSGYTFCEPVVGAKTLGSYASDKIVALPYEIMNDQSFCGKEIILSHNGKEWKGMLWDRSAANVVGVSYATRDHLFDDCADAMIDYKVLDKYYTDPL